MGTNTLNNRSAGQTILDTFFNDIHQAMNGDFVGRNSSGVPTASQNLGTAALPWGTIRADALVLLGAAVDTSQITSPQNRVISGKKRSTSNQPAYLVPNGGADSFILDGTPTNLLVDINGVSYTINTDITKSSLTLAPASNNTCLVDDADAADQHDTKLWGEPEHRKSIIVDNMGSGITALVGKMAAFKIAGVGTEYFIAYVKSSTELTNCKRGYFYDSSANPINRTGFSNNDTITLMSWGHVFIDDDTTTIDVSYVNPTWAFTSPTSPATGDYWYDMANNTWKRYDGASWQIIGRTYIGSVIIDTANCVGARCEDFYAKYDAINELELELSTTEIAIQKKPFGRVNTAGVDLKFGLTRTQWNMTTHLAGSNDMYDATEQASRLYYLYLKDTGAQVISDISPYYRYDLYGMYHPHNPWRCVGMAYNNGSSNLICAGDFRPENNVVWLTGGAGTSNGSINTTVRCYRDVREQKGANALYDSGTNATLGTFNTITAPGTYSVDNYDKATGEIHGTTINPDATDRTTSVNAIASSKCMMKYQASANVSYGGSIAKRFLIGDEVYPQCEGAGGETTSDTPNAQWRVQKHSALML